MGYTTSFSGEFRINPPLLPHQNAYLNAFNKTRRMKRDPKLLKNREDHERIAVGLPLGIDGEYYVGSQGDYGQIRTNDILNYNSPPSTQPGLWCQWVPTNDGTALVWDGREKFYEYDKWLEYVIQNFLLPWGYLVNGTVNWFGEDNEDMGILEVVNNVLTVKIAVITYG